MRSVIAWLATPLLLASAALANDLANSGFASSLQGWTVPSGAAVWSPIDADGKAGSGSLVLTNSEAGALASVTVSQCVNLPPGAATVRFRGRPYVPSGQSRTGRGYASVSWFSQPNCSAFLSGSGFPITNNLAFDTWGPSSGTGPPFLVEAGAQSANFEFSVLKHESGGGLTIHFDSGIFIASSSLELQGARFSVYADWETGAGDTGLAHAVQLTSDAGYLWFFGSTNIEAVVKVLNGCSLNQRYWVFAAGLTNVRVVLYVHDRQTGAVKTYVNPQGTKFEAIQDTAAFATCP